MTTYVQYELRCDGMAGPYDCEPAFYANTRDENRRVANRAGWVRVNGKDYCADHRPAAKGYENR